jgi:putative tricarboxylic transport membrane protein
VPGGNGSIGLGRFLSSPSDAEILVTGLTMLDALLVQHAPVDLDQMTPLARLCAEPFAIVVPAASPIRTIGDLKVALQTEPSKISWAGGPVGGVDHAGAALLALASGIAPASLNYVPFVATGDAVAATVEGKVTAAFLSTAELGASLKAGQVRVLAVASSARLPSLEAPTLAETGVDLEFANWRGLMARPGLSPADRVILEALVADVVRSARWRELVVTKGWQEAYLGPAAFATFIQAEKARLKLALKTVGVLKSGAD